jgi:hypothetical protein
LLSTYFGTKKLAIFFYKQDVQVVGSRHFLVSPARPDGLLHHVAAAVRSVTMLQALRPVMPWSETQLVTLKNRSSFLEVFC